VTEELSGALQPQESVEDLMEADAAIADAQAAVAADEQATKGDDDKLQRGKQH
jgi:hypothetical protein